MGIEEYSGKLTGEPFMLHESKIVTSMLLNNSKSKEIKESIIQNNTFGYKTIKSVPKRVQSIIRRLKNLDTFVLKKIVNDLSGDGKIIILYAIAIEDRLLYELITEQLSNKFATRDLNYSKKEIERFIYEKSEINDKLNSFTESTKKKIASVIFNILIESGLISKKMDKYQLQTIGLSLDLKKYLEDKNIRFLKGIGVPI